MCIICTQTNTCRKRMEIKKNYNYFLSSDFSFLDKLYQTTVSRVLTERVQTKKNRVCRGTHE